MAYTNTTAVAKILGDDYDGATDLQQYIDSADVIVLRVNTLARQRRFTLSTTELEIIERWLAAHCYVQMDQTYASKNTEGASMSAHGQTAKGIEGSKYGLFAINADVSGMLKAIANRQFARCDFGGKHVQVPPCGGVRSEPAEPPPSVNYALGLRGQDFGGAQVHVGQSISITVTALDDDGNTFAGYTGKVSFSSNDTLANLPASGQSLINGVGVFSIRFGQAGDWNYSVSDDDGRTAGPGTYMIVS